MDGKKVVWGLGGVLGVCAVIGVVVAWKIKAIIRELPAPVSSPDGAWVAGLAVTESPGVEATNMKLAVEIKDKEGKRVMWRQTLASGMRYYDLRWEGSGKLVLESSEVGNILWELRGGEWVDGEGNEERVVGAATRGGSGR